MSSTLSPPRALAHPLPAGMRDLLPAEAQRRRALGRSVLDHFTLHGYRLVTPPAFEFAEVLERGLDAGRPADVLRFVEPESGEVAALRPDMTPQIARMVATRLSREPLPMRLCYEGTIVRQRQGRARRHRQVPQAGVELYGVASLAGDVEMLRLAASVVRAAGLKRFVLDVGHAAIARALIAPFPADLSLELTDALVQKDSARIESILRLPSAAKVPTNIARALATLPDLYGGGDFDPDGAATFKRAEALLAGTDAESALRELKAIWTAAKTPIAGTARTTAFGSDISDVLRLDLGEVRGFAYYTGAIFHILAEGPGEPLLTGGRYDDLLARFDVPMPAIGFALHLDTIAWARESAGIVEKVPASVVVAIGPGGDEIAATLRGLGFPAVEHGPSANPQKYADAWNFSYVVTAEDDRIGVYRNDGKVWQPLVALPIMWDSRRLAQGIADAVDQAEGKPMLAPRWTSMRPDK